MLNGKRHSQIKKAQAGEGLGLNPPKEEGGGDSGACGPDEQNCPVTTMRQVYQLILCDARKTLEINFEDKQIDFFQFFY